MLLKLAYKSLLERKSAVMLALISITIGIMLLISIQFINNQVKSSFSKTISGIDLIVGAKTSDVNLLLYSVFHVGAPTDNMSWDGFETIKNNEKVNWAIPVSLGDSHRGYRVIGTDDSYFNFFRYGNKQSLKMQQGKWFEHPFDVVLGYDVAQKLNYTTLDSIHLSHGVGKTSFKKHDQIEFNVSGVLEQTGTPVDQSLFVSLTGLEAVHINWPKNEQQQIQLTEMIVARGLEPQSITASYVALKNKSSAFVFQRQINQLETEPLQAILPGVALAQLWNLSNMFENILWLIGVLVFISTVIGLVNMLIASLQSRKKELALLRIIGASPFYCFLLIQIESLLVLMAALLLAFVIAFLLFYGCSDWLANQYGFFIDLTRFINFEVLITVGAMALLSFLLVCIPASMFYKQSIVKNIN